MSLHRSCIVSASNGDEVYQRIGGDLARFGRLPRRGEHKPDRPPCGRLCHGHGEVCNPGNADPAVKVTDWLAPVGCPRCGQTGKDPNP